MRKLTVFNVLYDTDVSTEICGDGRTTLYRTNKGAWFVYYRSRLKAIFGMDSRTIRPISCYDAYLFMYDNSPENAEKYFDLAISSKFDVRDIEKVYQDEKRTLYAAVKREGKGIRTWFMARGKKVKRLHYESARNFLYKHDIDAFKKWFPVDEA